MRSYPKKSSAYFDVESQPNIIKSGYSPEEQEINDHKYNSLPISFPSKRDVLWDRTPISRPHYLKPDDVIPQLHLSDQAIRRILSNLIESENFKEKFSIIDSSHPSTVLSHQPGDHPVANRIPSACVIVSTDDITAVNNFYSTSNEDNSGLKLHNITIPFESHKTTDNLYFDNDSIDDLVDNLAMEMRSSADLMLKSCLRIRGKGCAKPIGSSKQGSIHLEAILPNMVFLAVQVSAIPILQTPVSQLLIHANNCSPRFGYLTMNQTRNLVVINASDSAISMCPIIGIWCRLEETTQVGNVLRHPIVWGACVKYLAVSKVKDRAFIAPFTFLLVVFVGSNQVFMEITLLPAQECYTSTSADYMRMDFTVDVISEEDIIDEVGIMCKFKPAIPSAYKDESLIKRRSDKHDMKVNHTFGKNSNNTSNRMVEASTPQPRSLAPDPLSYSTLRLSEQFRQPTSIDYLNQRHLPLSQSMGSPGMFSTLAQHVRDEITPVIQPTSSQPQLVSPPEVSDPYFPSKVVLAQQMQIDALSRQVEELKMMVLALGGSLSRPVNNHAISSPPPPPPSSTQSFQQSTPSHKLPPPSATSSLQQPVDMIAKPFASEFESSYASTISKRSAESISLDEPPTATIIQEYPQLVISDSKTILSQQAGPVRVPSNHPIFTTVGVDPYSVASHIEEFEKYSAFYEESESILAIESKYMRSWA